MNTRTLGKNGSRVSALGLGCMGMSDLYGPADEAESIATLHAALDAGINLLDTGDFYGMGHNEMLIREALKGRSQSGVLPTCRELGIGITAYGVLSRGLLSGHWSKERAGGGPDFRTYSPRFQGENLDRNLALVEALRAAESKGVTVAQAAIAWVLSRGEDVLPLVGARRRDRLAESLGTLDSERG